MTDLAELPDDVIVTELQRRLDRGTLGWEGLMSTDQANHRDNWCALLETIHAARNRYPAEFGTRLILERAYALQDQQGPQTHIYRINTTFHGCEANKDHKP